jgi:hypothetical protein
MRRARHDIKLAEEDFLMPLSNVRRQALKFELKPIVDAYLSEHPATVSQYKQLGQKLSDALAAEAAKPAQAEEAKKPEAAKPEAAKPAQAEAAKPAQVAEAKKPEAAKPGAAELDTGKLDAAMQKIEAALKDTEKVLADISQAGQQATLLVTAAQAADEDMDDDSLAAQAMEESALAAAGKIKIDPASFVESVAEAAAGTDIEIDIDAVEKLGTGGLTDEQAAKVQQAVTIETGLDDLSLLDEAKELAQN